MTVRSLGCLRREVACPRCLLLTAHVNRNGRWHCRTRGTDNTRELPESVQQRRDRKGGSGRGGIQPSTANTAFAVPPLPSLHGEGLAAYDQRIDFASFVFDAAGLALEPNRVQSWHVGEHALRVKPWLDKRGFHVLGLQAGWPPDIRRKGGRAPKSLALAEVFATSWAHRPLLPSPREIPRWKRRALLRAGHVDAPVVALVDLPDDAPHEVRAVWEGIHELLVVRSLVEPAGEPVPISAPFLARWCPLDENAVRRAKAWLGRRGFIERAEVAEFGFPRPCVLWKITRAREPLSVTRASDVITAAHAVIA